MGAAMRVKGGALPRPESCDQAQPGDAGHQIHLAGGDQATHDGLHRDPARTELDVILFEQLRHGVVAGNVKHDGGGAHLFRMDIVGGAGGNPRMRQCGLDHEEPVSGEMPGGPVTVYR